jgi:hypothetical protein
MGQTKEEVIIIYFKNLINIMIEIEHPYGEHILKPLIKAKDIVYSTNESCYFEHNGLIYIVCKNKE